MEDLEKYINQFGIIKKEVFNELKKCFHTKELKKNEFFTREGEYSNEIGFLKDGIIRAYFKDETGKEFTKQFFISPSIIGAYTSIITSKPNKINHQALTKCTMLIADYNLILKLYDKHHSLERIGRKIAEFHYVKKEEKLIEHAVLCAEKRYANLKNNFPAIENKIPQYHIASYLGISPTQLSRIRKKISNFSLHM